MMTKTTTSMTPSRVRQTRRPLTLLRRAATFFALWRERRALASLDDHLLRDIGKTRAEVDREASRPAWDAPSRWLR